MILFKRDAWQVFLMLLLPLIIASLIGDAFYIPFTIASIIAYFVIFGWYFVVGSNLNDRLSDEDYRSDILFKLNCFYLFGFLSISAVLKDNGEVVETEMPPYLIVLFAYYVFAFLQVVHFSVRSFILNQEREGLEKKKVEIVYLSFLIVFIGVWVLQPDLKKIFANNQVNSHVSDRQ